MAINQDDLKAGWVKQVGSNCGSCCVGSIINYAKRIRNDNAIAPMDANAYIGLTIGGVHSLGSVTFRLFRWLTQTYPAAFYVTEVKVANKKAHWGGAENMLYGGTRHRPTITPDQAYFAQHNHRFLLREFSAEVVAGHFIIQTDANAFWDPNREQSDLPMNLANTKDYYRLLSERADALQIDVRSD
jgi:hypothetical protein